MRVLVLGAAGMLGRKLAVRLADEPFLKNQRISEFLLVDVLPMQSLAVGAAAVETIAADISQPEVAEDLLSRLPDVIFDLAAVVSGEAEADFDKGYKTNLDGARRLLDAARALGPRYRPRVVFTSSIAVFGPPLPDVIGDEHRTTPATSYGTQKAVAELLLSDYTRRGYVDGIAIRLPTICVRPGEPNLAASGFFSSIIREPLNGQPATLPVSETVRHWFASPRAAVQQLIFAANLDDEAIGPVRSLTMPGVSATVGMALDALRRVAGDDVLSLIKREPDGDVARIVAGWPAAFNTRRACALGFRSEKDFDDIIRVYIDDELEGHMVSPRPR